MFSISNPDAVNLVIIIILVIGESVAWPQGAVKRGNIGVEDSRQREHDQGAWPNTRTNGSPVGMEVRITSNVELNGPVVRHAHSHSPSLPTTNEYPATKMSMPEITFGVRKLTLARGRHIHTLVFEPDIL